MATSAKPAAKPADPTVPQNPKKKLFIIIGAAAAVLIAGGAGWYFAKGSAGDHHEEVKVVPPKPPIFLPLQATPFLANLTPDKPECRDSKRHDDGLNCVEQYIQVAISLKYFVPELEARIKLNLPEINSKVLQLLTTKTARELLSQEGKTRLARDIVSLTNSVLGIAEPVARPALPVPQAASQVAEAGSAQADAAAPVAPPPPPVAQPAAVPPQEKKGVVDALFTSFIIQ